MRILPVFVSLLFDKDTKIVIQQQYNGIRIPHDFFTTSQLIGWVLSQMHNRRQGWAAHLLLPPGLNVPDGRLPDDEPNTVTLSENVQSNTKPKIVLLTPLLLGLTRACPPSLIVCSPALAPQKFLDFLRAVRTFRGRERPFARNERLSHRGRILGRNVRLKWVVAPQRRWSSSSSSWVAAELARGASSHCRRSRDLTAKS